MLRYAENVGVTAFGSPIDTSTSSFFSVNAQIMCRSLIRRSLCFSQPHLNSLLPEHAQWTDCAPAVGIAIYVTVRYMKFVPLVYSRLVRINFGSGAYNLIYFIIGYYYRRCRVNISVSCSLLYTPSSASASASVQCLTSIRFLRRIFNRIRHSILRLRGFSVGNFVTAASALARFCTCVWRCLWFVQSCYELGKDNYVT